MTKQDIRIIYDFNKLYKIKEEPRKPIREPHRMMKCPYCQNENYKITNAIDESTGDWLGAYSIEGTAHCDDCDKDFLIDIFIDTLGDAQSKKMEDKQ